MMAQARQPNRSDDPPAYWLVTDNRPGHLNQLLGLGARLVARTGGRLYRIDCEQYPLSLWRWLRARPPRPPAPPPALIIGAGHRTHRLLHALSRAWEVPGVVLMRPSLPLNWFDAAIIPGHDSPPKRPHVLTTQGALNNITPLERVTSARQGLILLGGASKHFRWSDPHILAQVVELCRASPDWQWHLSNSARTPHALGEQLAQQVPDNLRIHAHDNTGPDWVRSQLASSAMVWVSPDSVSMVFEALTAGVPTGLFNLEPVARSRVAQAIQDLRAQQRVMPWPPPASHFQSPPASPKPLWEADRAARWLIERYELAPANPISETTDHNDT